MALIFGMLKWHFIILLLFFTYIYINCGHYTDRVCLMFLQFFSDSHPIAPTVFPGNKGHLQSKTLGMRNYACHRFENLLLLKYLLLSSHASACCSMSSFRWGPLLEVSTEEQYLAQMRGSLYTCVHIVLHIVPTWFLHISCPPDPLPEWLTCLWWKDGDPLGENLCRGEGMPNRDVGNS